jgi:polysaccharide biosynthesis protein PslG
MLFGMDAQTVFTLFTSGDEPVADRSLSEIRRLGATFVRSPLNWQVIEPRPPLAGEHRYAFGSLDRWMTVLSRDRLRWQPIGIGSAPAWALDPPALAAGCGPATPPRPRPYAAMMRALAERYGPGGSFWSAHPDLPYDPVTTYEVWNEPNLATFWCPRPDPAAYARIYLAAHQAIHAADPEATVLLGGLAPVTASEPQEAPTKMAVGDFLARAIQAKPGLPDGVDAVAVHPYAPTPGAVLRTVVWFRNALSGAGLGGVPMTVNEFGWPTRGSEGPLAPVTEATRARYIAAATRNLAGSGCGLIGIAPHTWISPQHGSLGGKWYGLANPLTGRPYPSARAYGRAVIGLERGAMAEVRGGCGG